MQAMSLERTARTETIQAALIQCKEEGVSYQAISAGTGVSRTAISQVANHGVALHAAKLNRLESWLRENAPHTLEADDESGGQQLSMLRRNSNVTIYPTQDMQKLIGWLTTVYQHRAIGALVGPAGSGKTTILQRYREANPAAKYMKCWQLMHMRDLLDMIAQAFDITLKGTLFRRQQQLIAELRGRDAMLLLDEAEFLKKWNISKLEVLREIWDASGIPIVLCGTDGLKDVLTRGTGRENCAQLYRRCWQGMTSGISAEEMNAILGDYKISTDAARALTDMAVDHRHGGMGNAFEMLRIAQDIAEGEIITGAILKQATQYKVLFR